MGQTAEDQTAFTLTLGLDDPEMADRGEPTRAIGELALNLTLPQIVVKAALWLNQFSSECVL